MKKLAATLFLGLALAGCASDPQECPEVDMFDQRTFPCQEDEVLGYGTEFGADRVGCIHIDDIER